VPTVYRLNYQPDVDTNWSTSPGACTTLDGLVPTKNGALQTIDYDTGYSFNTTGTDVLHAKMFTQVDGSVRLLAFRVGDIDEYSSTGTRTNRATGLTSSTDWSAAAWGNQIIAVSKAVATQSSTGAGFSALGGGSPKAAHIAANVNFAMMADVDDGGSNVYADMVWWSAIRNPSSWTPSLATQAGNVRLLDTPGPIKALVGFGERFVAFKENSIYVGQYVGPPYVFAWKVVNSVVGCSFPKSVVELDGRLYFAHRSGYFAFDGQQVTNVGEGVASRANSTTEGGFYAATQSRADEETGNVWFCGYGKTTGGGTFYNITPVIHNARTGLWSHLRTLQTTSASGSPQAVVQCTTAQTRAFFSTTSTSAAVPFMFFGNDARFYAATVSGNTLSDKTISIITGKIGANDAVGSMVRIYPRFTSASNAAPATSLSYCRVNEYSTEFDTSGTAITFNWNSETGTFDGIVSSRYFTIELVYTTGAGFELSGLGVDILAAGKR
jgi:hypothetical protein